jgi:SAM-dependent methyltransferase
VSAIYDTIGVDYANLRRPDVRIAAVIDRALGPAETVLNVGAGTGSYEPAHRKVTALEPSGKMIAQRKPGAAPCIQGFAEHLPFDDDAFDAAMAVLTVHHWSDKAKGLSELRRVATGRVVILTYDAWFHDFWLLDYFPELVTLDQGQMPRMEEYGKWLGPVEIAPVPVPHDCTDGFLNAYWRRPAVYLDARIRSGMSPFWMIDNVPANLARLERDLASGAWEERYGHLMTLDALDTGYRLVISG